MKTKQQEREALEQIRNILKDFGPDTYLGMAFEGCVQDAEDNIENDFGNSMKQRFDSAVQQIEKLESKIKDLTDKAKRAEEALERAERKTLPDKTMGTIFSVIYNHQTRMEAEAKSQAENIVLLADDPTQPNFIDAVARHRACLNVIKKDEDILDAINKARQ